MSSRKAKQMMDETTNIETAKCDHDKGKGYHEYHGDDQQWTQVFDEASTAAATTGARPWKKIRSPERNQSSSQLFNPFPCTNTSSKIAFPFAFDGSSYNQINSPQFPVLNPQFIPQQQQQHQQMISFNQGCGYQQYQYQNQNPQMQQQLQYWRDAMNLSPRGRMMMMNRFGIAGQTGRQIPQLPFVSFTVRHSHLNIKQLNLISRVSFFIVLQLIILNFLLFVMENPPNSKRKVKEIINHNTEFQQNHHHQIPEFKPQIEGNDSSNPEDDHHHIPNFGPQIEGCDSSEGEFHYSRSKMIHELATYLNLQNLPLKSCESKNFERYVKLSLQPAFERVPLKQLVGIIVKAYRMELGVLKQYIVDFNGGFSITADLWSSVWGERFVCVNCRWIDENWNVQNRVLGFRIISDDATRLGFCQEVINVLDEFELRSKVCCVSIRSSFDDDECVDYVAKELKPKFGELFAYDRKCVYVANLCAQQGMEQLELLINPIRELIMWARRSYRDYKDEFIDMCKEVGLKPRFFPLNCVKSWKSTYEMLSVVFPYREILTKLYKDNVDDCLDLRWDCIGSIVRVFEKFSDAIRTFSLAYEPSCHLAIQECIHIVHVLKTYENDPFLCLVVRNMKKKWLEQLSDIPTFYCIATILDPRVKIDGLLRLLKYYYETLGVTYCVEEKLSECRAVFYRLHAHYASQMLTSSKGEAIEHSSFGSELIMHILKKEGIGGQGNSREYDEYLSFDHIIPDDFDILKWWKARVEHFPVLSRVAKNILCTPSSTAALESVYSTGEGERVLDQQWRTFQPSKIQACICKRDWDLAGKRAQCLVLQRVDDDDPWMMDVYA